MTGRENRVVSGGIRFGLDVLIGPYCVYVTELISRNFFNGQLSGARFAAALSAVFISGYPIWGWKRNSRWNYIGRWSFAKLVVAGLGVGIFAIVVNVLANVLVNHYTSVH